MSTCPCSGTKTTPKLLIAPGCSCSGGTTRTPFECITQTSSFIAPAVGTQASFKVATIAGFYSVGLYLHVFNAAGVAWVGRIVSMIEADTVITLERIDFEGTVAASTNMGLTVCLLNVGAVLPAVAGDCHPFAAKVMTGSWAIPSTGALGTLGITGCWDLNVGQGLFVGSLGWIRVQQILTDTESELTFTYLVVQLLGTASAGNPIPVNSLVFASEIQVNSTAEPVPSVGVSGDLVLDYAIADLGGTLRAWEDNTMKLIFTTPWDCKVDIFWKVGHGVTFVNAAWTAHWGVKVNGAVASNWTCDAEMTGYMGCSTLGHIVRSMAANVTQTVEIYFNGWTLASGSAPTGAKLDAYHIWAVLHRTSGLTSLAGSS